MGYKILSPCTYNLTQSYVYKFALTHLDRRWSTLRETQLDLSTHVADRHFWPFNIRVFILTFRKFTSELYENFCKATRLLEYQVLHRHRVPSPVLSPSLYPNSWVEKSQDTNTNFIRNKLNFSFRGV